MSGKGRFKFLQRNFLAQALKGALLNLNAADVVLQQHVVGAGAGLGIGLHLEEKDAEGKFASARMQVRVRWLQEERRSARLMASDIMMRDSPSNRYMGAESCCAMPIPSSSAGSCKELDCSMKGAHDAGDLAGEDAGAGHREARAGRRAPRCRG